MGAGLGEPDIGPIRPASPPVLPVRGRDRHLAAVDAAIGAVVEGLPGVVLIEGAAGYGKSRLLREAAARARAAGIHVAQAGADPDDRDAPFLPLLAALSQGSPPVLPLEDLRRLQDVRDDRYWFVLELGEALERASITNPLLIAIDDLQWADSSTLSAIRTLSGRLASAPILWVLALRPRHESYLLAQMVAEWADAGARRLTLPPLGPEAVQQVLCDHLSIPPDDTCLDVAAAADGVPFYLVELARGLVVDDLVDLAGPAATMRRDGLDPGSLISLGHRMGRLSTVERHVVQVGSVLGRTFRGDDVATMLHLPTADLIDAYEGLIRADILVGTDGDWAFSHDILRQAVLDAMAVPMRTTLERHAADVLLAAGIPPIDIARRVAAGAAPGDQRAIDTLAAAARALATTDPATAAELAEHAFVLTPVHHEARARLASEAVVYMHLAGREEEAFRLAGDMLSEVSEPQQFSDLQLSVARMYSLPGHTRVQCGLRALSTAGVSEVARARHLAVLVLSHTAAGNVEEAGRTAAEASRLVAATGDSQAELHLAFARMTLDEACSRYSDALERLPTIRRLAALTGDGAPALGAEWLRANVLVCLDDFEQAWEVSNEALQFAREHRQAWIASRWEFWQGWCLLQQGRLSDARAVLEGALTAEGLSVATAIPDAAGYAALGRVARHLGDQQLVDRCHLVARNSLRLPTSDDARRHLGWLAISTALAGDDLDAAREAVASTRHNDTVLPVLSVDVGAAVSAVRAGRQLGDDALAAAAASAARLRAQRNPGHGSLAAAAAHATGVERDDIPSLEAASVWFASGPRPLAAASAFEDLGRLRARAGDHAGAVEALGRSLEFATATGAAWDAGRLRKRLRALGVRRRITVPSRPQYGWDSLTPAEIAVATNVGQGMTNRETAETLFLSPHTVGAHLRHVFEKLGIRSRFELARLVASLAEPPAS